jgi:hypothetical protein
MRLLAASARKAAWDMGVRAGLCKKWISNPAQMQAGSIGKILIDADPFDYAQPTSLTAGFKMSTKAVWKSAHT